MTQHRINGITLDTATRRIEGPHGSVHLPPKPYAVLMELLRDPGGVVSRDVLLERVWPERPASDETLSRAVADLRKYLGDDARPARYIETVPKVGYRLLVTPQRVGRPRLTTRPWLAAGAAALMGVLAIGAFLLNRASDPAGDPSLLGGILQQPLPMTTDEGDEDTPDFSPNGRWLVYAAHDPGEQNWDLRLRDVESGETSDLVTGPDWEYAPAFSPDGGRIAFLRYRGEHCEIVVTTLLGQEQSLAKCRTPMMSYLDWSPDGSRLVYSDTSQKDSTLILNVVDIESGHTRRLVQPADTTGHQFAPKYSPDGSQVAFLSGSYEQNEIWLVETTTGRAHRTTEMEGWITGLAWNEDGSALYFTTTRPEQALWRLEPGREPVHVRWINGHTPAYDPVNQRLVYDHIEFRTNIWSIVRVGEGAWSDPALRVSSTRVDNGPSLSPDGSLLAFTSDRAGDWAVWIAEMEGDNERRLTDKRATSIDRPAWSPDGNALAYSMLVDGQWDIHLHPLDGRPVRSLGVHGSEPRHPVWSTSGEWLFFASTEGIRRFSPADGRDESVLDVKGAIPLFERDQDLYYLRPDQPGIHRLGSDGPAEPLLTQFNLVVPAAISPSRDRLFFAATSPNEGRRHIFSADPETGRSLESIQSLISYTRHAQLSVTPDGNLVLFSQASDIDSDLQLLEGLP